MKDESDLSFFILHPSSFILPASRIRSANPSVPVRLAGAIFLQAAHLGVVDLLSVVGQLGSHHGFTLHRHGEHYALDTERLSQSLKRVEPRRG